MKKIGLVLSIVIMLFTNMINAEAKEKNESDSVVYHVNGTLNNEVINGSSDEIKFIDNTIINQNNMARKVGNGTYLFSLQNIYTRRITNVYENGYSEPKLLYKMLSGAWAKRSEYTESQTYSVEWNKSANISADIAKNVQLQFGLSKSVSVGYDIGSVIPADPTRYSKLALYADYYDYYLKCVEINANATEIYNTYYGDVLFPTGDCYFEVVYQ